MSAGVVMLGLRCVKCGVRVGVIEAAEYAHTKTFTEKQQRAAQRFYDQHNPKRRGHTVAARDAEGIARYRAAEPNQCKVVTVRFSAIVRSPTARTGVCYEPTGDGMSICGRPAVSLDRCGDHAAEDDEEVLVSEPEAACPA